MKIIKATKLVSEINKNLQKTINETTKEENKLIYINRILLVIFDTINKINSLKEEKKDRTKNILKNIDNFEIIGLSFSTLLAITNTFAIEIVAISELTFFLLTFTTKSIIKINNWNNMHCSVNVLNSESLSNTSIMSKSNCSTCFVCFSSKTLEG